MIIFHGSVKFASFPFNAILPPILQSGDQVFSETLRPCWFNWLKEGWVPNLHYSELQQGSWHPYQIFLNQQSWAHRHGKLYHFLAQRLEEQIKKETNVDSRNRQKDLLRHYKKKIARRKHKTKRAWRRGRKPRSARKSRLSN